MTFEELRKISIVELLAHLGIQPEYRTGGGTQWFYRSPLRADKNASFSVSITKNVWMDFGTSNGGNVIDLAIALNGDCSFGTAARWLEEQYRAFGDRIHIDDIIPRDCCESGIECVHTAPLENPVLKGYLQSRGIPPEIGVNYCGEVHYRIKGKMYYGLCFMNILGGMEIRNPFFKGCSGEKAPSILALEKSSRTECCCVFEGFMDFLSYQTLKLRGDWMITQEQDFDCIVMNSTSLFRRTAPFIDVYSKAFCYLDNDEGGRNAFSKLEELLPGKVESCSSRYADYNDVNDYLIQRPSFQ